LKSFIEKKVGENFDFVPATSENLSYRMTITAIEKALDVTPEVYAKKRGFKDLTALKTAVKEKLGQDINSSAFLYHKNQILEELGKLYSFELPQGVVEQEKRNVIATAKMDLEKNAGGGDKEKGKRSKKAPALVDEKLEKDCLDIARKRVLLGYVLNKIAMKEKITVSEKELRDVISAEINRNQHIAEALIERYSNDRDAVNYKKAEIIEYKVVSFLISKANATQVAKTKKEVDTIVKKLLDD
jgi:trigger factor